jgi:hypothetical protein
MLKTVAITFMVVTLLFSLNNAAIVHVPDDAATIGAAIQSAADGDTILIAPGTYLAGSNLISKSMTIAGNYLLSGDSSDIKTTRIDDSRFSSITTSRSVKIAGITFTNCVISSGGTGLTRDSVFITRNIFNSSRISLSGTGDIGINARISDNMFKAVKRHDCGIDCGGTGNLKVDVVVKNNTFDKAVIDLGGTGKASIKATITGNTFSAADSLVTAISCGGTGECTVKAAIDSNRFYGANFGISGTGLFLVNANLTRNVFYGIAGSAIALNRISCANYTCNLVNNTIVGNTVGVNYDKVGGLIILNCIIWYNDTDLVNVNKEQVSYSLWNSGLSPISAPNITGDPMLADTANHDFSLLEGSPCIASGTFSPFSDFRNISLPQDIGAIPYQHREPPTAIAFNKASFLEPSQETPFIQGSLLHTGYLHGKYSQIMVYTINGKLVEKISLNTLASAVDIRGFSLSAGSYIIRVIQGRNATTLHYQQR